LNAVATSNEPEALFAGLCCRGLTGSAPSRNS
jgi:hypothetical protein